LKMIRGAGVVCCSDRGSYEELPDDAQNQCWSQSLPANFIRSSMLTRPSPGVFIPALTSKPTPESCTVSLPQSGILAVPHLRGTSGRAKALKTTHLYPSTCC
jgi:hypothetical protein